MRSDLWPQILVLRFLGVQSSNPPRRKIPGYAAGVRVKSRVYPYPRVRVLVQRHGYGSGTGNVLRVGSGTGSQNGVPAQP